MEPASLGTLPHVTSRTALLRCLIDFAHGLDFERVSLGLANDGGPRGSTFSWVSNTPRRFAQRAVDREAGLRDPVIAAIRHRHDPVCYDQSTYVRSEAGDLWEEQAPFGYKCGIAVAMHLGGGRHLVTGIDRPDPLPHHEKRRAELLGAVLLMASIAVAPAFRLLDTNAPAPVAPVRLSARERAVLAWTCEGKSSWAAGRILGISESTVNFHLRNAMRKFGTCSKHVAAARAAAAGLLG